MNTPFGNATYSTVGAALRAVFEQAVGDVQRQSSEPQVELTPERLKIASFVAGLPDQAEQEPESKPSLLDGIDTEKLAVDRFIRIEPHVGAVDQSAQNVLHRMIYTEEKAAEWLNGVGEAVYDVLCDPVHRMNDIERSTRIFGRPVKLGLWDEFSDRQVKLALTSALVPRPAPLVPLQQPVQQPLMQQPGLPAAGASPIAPTAPTMTGVQQKPIGLDRPQDTRAAAIPGTPGHAATNVIDQYGALDPRGLTVDGNNSAAVTKIPKMAGAIGPSYNGPTILGHRGLPGPSGPND